MNNRYPSGCELVTLANVLAIQLSQGLTAEELAILGGFFNSLGDNLGLLAATKVSPIRTEEKKGSL